MNIYKFRDLTVGMSESFGHVVTEEDMQRFILTTEDTNPLHNNSEFAVQHGFQDCVVYGMLTASLLSTLGGVYLPGKYCLIQQVEIKFVAPVFVGDSLCVTGIVKELNDSVQQATIKVEIKNQYCKRVLKGILKVGFLE